MKAIFGSKKSIGFKALVILIGLSMVACTKEKETLTHPPQQKKESEEQKKEEPKSDSSGEQLSPSQMPDLPEGNPTGVRSSKPTTEGTVSPPKPGVVEEKAKSNGVTHRIVESDETSNSSSSSSFELEPGDSKTGQLGSIDYDKPLSVTYLPKSDELENCNAEINMQWLDTTTGGATPSLRDYTTGVRDGFMSYMKSMVNCQDERMRRASKSLAAAIDGPIVSISKSRGVARVTVPVYNGGELETFHFQGKLLSKGGFENNFAVMEMVSATAPYQFRAKLFCVDQSGDCENTMVVLEQLQGDTVCKRVYFTHRFGSGWVHFNGIDELTLEGESNDYKLEFMELMHQTVKYFKEDVCMYQKQTNQTSTQTQCEGIKKTQVRSAKSLKHIGYSTTAVAYGASTFELLFETNESPADKIVIRGPLLATTGEDEKLDRKRIQFGHPGSASVAKSSALMSNLNPNKGRSRYFSNVELIKNLGDGNLQLLVYFVGEGTGPVFMSTNPHFVNPVIEVRPAVIAKPL